MTSLKLSCGFLLCVYVSLESRKTCVLQVWLVLFGLPIRSAVVLFECVFKGEACQEKNNFGQNSFSESCWLFRKPNFNFLSVSFMDIQTLLELENILESK